MEKVKYLNSLRTKNPELKYPDSLLDGSMKDIMEFEVKAIQKLKVRKGTVLYGNF